MSYYSYFGIILNVFWRVCVCVCLCCLSLFCLLPPSSPFHCRQDGKLFPPRRSGGCDLSYFRLSITSRTTTSSAFIRMLSVWVCTSVSILAIASSIFKHTEVLSHKLHGETRDQSPVVSVSTEDWWGQRLSVCVFVCAKIFTSLAIAFGHASHTGHACPSHHQSQWQRVTDCLLTSGIVRRSHTSAHTHTHTPSCQTEW